MVRAASENPCAGADLEGGLGNPEGAGHGQVGHGLGLDALYLLRDEAEAVAKVHDGSLDAGACLAGEHEAGGLLLADADAEEVYLELGFVYSDEGAYLKHVALQARAAVAGEVEGVVLEERAAGGQALRDDPEGALQAGRLPVALGTEAEALSHQALRSEAGDLVEAAEVGIVDVGIAEVVEVGGEGCSALILEHAAQGNLGLGCVVDLLPVHLFAALVDLDGVELLVLFNELIGFSVGNLLVVVHEAADGVVVDVVAQALLELYAVAVGHGNVVHVHAEHEAAYVVGISYAGSHAGPYGNLLLCLFVLPVAADDLAGHAHAGADVSELDVAVGALVEVHEVHVDLAPGNLGVVLCVEVEEGLLQLLQAFDPHLGGREGVHPGDDTCALLVVVGSEHDLLHFLGAVGRALIYNLHGDIAALVQSGNHFLGVSVDSYDSITSIEQLCTSHPPKF